MKINGTQYIFRPVGFNFDRNIFGGLNGKYIKSGTNSWLILDAFWISRRSNVIFWNPKRSTYLHSRVQDADFINTHSKRLTSAFSLSNITISRHKSGMEFLGTVLWYSNLNPSWNIWYIVCDHCMSLGLQWVALGGSSLQKVCYYFQHSSCNILGEIPKKNSAQSEMI